MEKTKKIIEKINNELTELIKDSTRFGLAEAAALDGVWIVTSVDFQDIAYTIDLKIEMFEQEEQSSFLMLDVTRLKYFLEIFTKVYYNINK